MHKLRTWLDTRRLLACVLFLGIFALVARPPLDSDQWWHIASGDWMRRHGAIPRVDPFSHTVQGRPWTEHGWLPDILISLVFEKLGYAGLILILALAASPILADPGDAAGRRRDRKSVV